MKRALLALALAACCGPLDVEAPSALTPGEAQYAAAALVRGCTGRAVMAAEIEWAVVRSIKGDARNLGAWEAPNRIYLVDGALNDTLIAAHELVHHVLRGDPGHRNAAWVACRVMPSDWEG